MKNMKQLKDNKNKILLVSLFCVPNVHSNSRSLTIYDFLSQHADVTLVTSNFNHARKKTYNPLEFSHRKTQVISVPPYKKNFCLKRIFSHVVFAVRLNKYFKSLADLPSTIYCAMPPTLAACVCYRFCKKNKIRLAIDVIDIWPDALITQFKNKKVFDVLSWPWKQLSLYVYRHAAIIFCESEKYASYVRTFTKNTMVKAVYIGTDPKYLKSVLKTNEFKIKKPSDEIWICYGGSLEHNYDFEIILNGFKRIYEEMGIKLGLFFVGGGSKEKYIKTFAIENNLPITVTGHVHYNDYMSYLSACDIGLNVFQKNCVFVHSYKFNDYITAGLAIINNLKGETPAFIEKYKLGFSFDYENISFYDALCKLVSNPNLVNTAKKNALYVSENVLNKQIIYSDMIGKLLET